VNRISKFIVEHVWQAWAVGIVVTCAAALLAGGMARNVREKERIGLLEVEAKRLSIEIMSHTMNGNQMGALRLLGLIDGKVKQEALGQQPPNSPEVSGLMESLAHVYDGEGAFIVGQDGIIKSSWGVGKPLTGVDVKFRPYAQMALKGKESVYAAIGTTTGRRTLYFASPVHAAKTGDSPPIGAVVARGGVDKLDRLLTGKSGISLLLSPQGLVFAGSRPEWVGYLAEKLTPELLATIRQTKQFGTMFDSKEPLPLPLPVKDGVRKFEGRRYAVASVRLPWNDPLGDWKLVMLEDLSRTWQFGAAIVAGLLTLVIMLLAFFFLRSHHARFTALSQVQAYADKMEVGAKFKAQQAAASLRLQQATDTADLAQLFLKEMHQMLGALQGVVYSADGGSEGMLRLLASYACADNPPTELALGEGLLGQCALERCTRIVETAPDGFNVIRSGLGETVPAAVMMTPLLLNNNLLGVTEIAVLSVPGTHEREQLEEMGRLLAINLEILGRAAHTEKVLTEAAVVERDMVRLTEMERFSRLAHDREQRIVELKQEVNELCNRLADPPRYASAEMTWAYDDSAGVVVYETGNRLVRLNWDPSLESGNADVDREHRALFAVANDLLNAIVNGRPREEIDRIIGVLVREVTQHFDHEEAIQRSIGYAKVEEHAKIHRELIGKATHLIGDFKAGNIAVGPFFQFLAYDVVALHMLKEDSKFFPLFETAGHEVPTAQAEKEIPKLAELVDLCELQKLFTAFCESVGIASAIIDLEGTVLVSANWQHACTDFHRTNSESCQLCVESDTELALKLQEGQAFTMYTCKNGMTDAAAPIVVGGQHLANVFIGQFHLAEPDMDFFRDQARRYNYPEDDYLQAIKDAPVIDEQRLPVILGFLTSFAQMIGSMSLARRQADEAQQMLLDQAVLLKQERIAALSLAEDAERARQALETRSKES